MKNNISIFEGKLLVTHIFDDNQTCADLYIIDRQNLEEMVQHLQFSEISNVDKISEIERAFTGVHECAPGLSSSLKVKAHSSGSSEDNG